MDANTWGCSSECGYSSRNNSLLGVDVLPGTTPSPVWMFFPVLDHHHVNRYHIVCKSFLIKENNSTTDSMFTSLARAERDLVVLEVNAAFLTLFAIVTQTLLSKLFGFVPLDWKQFFMVIAIAMGAVFWMELPKAWKRWRMKG